MGNGAKGPESGPKHRKPMDAYPGGFLRDGSNGEGKGGGREFGIEFGTETRKYSVPIDVRVGVRANIPALLLYSTREKPTGKDEHDLRIQQAFREYSEGPDGPMRLLEKNPVQVVAVPRSLSLPTLQEYKKKEAWDLIILDGNGRARRAPYYDIQNIPCNIQTVEQITANFHRENHLEVTAEMVAKALKKEANKADASFVSARDERVGCRRINYTSPKPLSSKELQELVPSFFATQQA